MIKSRYIHYILIVLIISQYQLESQLLDNNKPKQKPHFIGEVNTEYEDYFSIAVDEISQMLNDEIPVNFKRGVFLIENAFYKGEMDWDKFCSEIDFIVDKLKPIAEKHSNKGTNLSKNWAVFTFMSDSIPENDFQPYSYDFNSFIEDYNYEGHMVSKLLINKKGNCVSMPFLYKILANELGAESFLTTAPMHFFIKIQDETGNWYNHEVTSGSFSRTSFIIESFGVTDRALQSGLYLRPLSEKESLAELLRLLVLFYEVRTGKYYGDIVVDAVNIGLKFNPNSLLIVSKINEISFQMYWYCITHNFPLENNKSETLKGHPILKKMYNQCENLKNILTEIGYTKFTDERYEKLVKEVMLMKYKY